jgi:predicted lactoylglutathione lyase
MPTKIFVNLAVNDLERSKEFYTKLGFLIDPQFTDKNAACIVISDTIYLMILVEDFFKRFTKKEIINPVKSTETILALSRDSKEEVEALVKKALDAGGSFNREPEEYEWMYTNGFQDPDGHIWEIVWMDITKMPKE